MLYWLDKIPRMHFASLALFLTVGLVSITAPTLYAQRNNTIDFGSKSMTFSDGLPDVHITALAQDKNDAIWISTLAGVSKFNGTTFTNYSRQHGLPNSPVRAMLCDASGTLWFGHDNGVVSYFQDGKINKLSLPDAFQDRSVVCIYEDRNRGLWFGLLGGGALRYNRKSFFELTEADGLLGSSVFTILQDKSGNYWFGTELGINKTRYPFEQHPDKSQKPLAFETLSEENGFPSQLIRIIYEDSYGVIWVGTRDKGLIRLPNGHFSSSKPEIYTKSQGIGENFVLGMLQDRKGQVWIATYGGGITKVLGGAQKPQFINYTIGKGLPNNFVYAIIEDRDGALWIGTNNGLTVLRNNNFELISQTNGLPTGNIFAVAQDDKGNYWLGTEEGLIKFNPAQNKGGKPKIQRIGFEDGAAEKQVSSVHVDKLGSVWFGTRSGGISVYRPHTSSVETIAKSGSASGNIVSITSDNTGKVWFATDNKGALVYDQSKKQMAVVSTQHGLSGNNVRAMLTDNTGRVWLATEGGLSCAEKNGVIRKFTSKDGIGNSLPTSMLEDKNGDIWIGSDGGLYKFSNGAFSRYSVASGNLSSDNVKAIAFDGEKTIWIGNDRGIDRFDIQTGRSIHYGKDDGFEGLLTNPNAVHKDDLGNIWFGTNRGVLLYRSTSGREESVSEPVAQITRVLLGGNEVNLAQRSEISYGSVISFDVQAVSLRSPSTVKFQYRLIGLDTVWSDLKTERKFDFRNLEPGKYVFMVRAFNNGRMSSQPAIFEFVVQPPFWRSFSFLAISFLGVTTLVLSGMYVRNRRVAARNKELEAHVAARTAELAQKTLEVIRDKEEMERMNAQLVISKIQAEQASRAKTDFLASVSHELRTPMNSILGFSRRLMRKSRDLSPEEIEAEIEIVYRNSQHLLSLINDMLDLTEAESGKTYYSIEPVNLAEVAHEIGTKLSALAEQKKISLQYLCVPILAECDLRRTKQIMEVLISTAIEHADSGVVRIYCSQSMQNKGIMASSISIHHEGKSFTDEQVQAIFEPFTQSSGFFENAQQSGLGLGLAIAKRLAEDMSGRITVVSTEQDGTTFTLVLPEVHSI